MVAQLVHWLTFSTHLSGHPTTPVRRASSGQDYTTQPRAIVRDTHTNHFDERYLLSTQYRETYSTEHRSNTGSSADDAFVDTTPGLASQEQFDQDVMIYYQGIDDSSLAAQFLNLDDEAWPCTDQIATVEPDPLATPSSSLSSVSTEDVPEWELEPSSLQLLDMKKFETVTDFDGEEKSTPWPWGDYVYRPRTPVSYPDPVECVMEYQFAQIEKTLREELMEAMAQEAIRDGMKATKRKEREARRLAKERRRIGRESCHPTLVAFNNQVIRGRTIYNP